MNKTICSPKPARADDYGKTIPQTPETNQKPKSTNTDGRKTLTLWSTSTKIIKKEIP